MLIDTGAACSCTTIPLMLTDERMRVTGIGDNPMITTWTVPSHLDLGAIVSEEPFWYLPENSEGTVLGMDIMQKYGFVIYCLKQQIEMMTEDNEAQKLDALCPLLNQIPFSS